MTENEHLSFIINYISNQINLVAMHFMTNLYAIRLSENYSYSGHFRVSYLKIILFIMHFCFVKFADSHVHCHHMYLCHHHIFLYFF